MSAESYKILQIPSSATPAECKKARDRLAKSLHPDKHPKGPKEYCNTEFGKVQQAYEEAMKRRQAWASTSLPKPPEQYHVVDKLLTQTIYRQQRVNIRRVRMSTDGCHFMIFYAKTEPLWLVALWDLGSRPWNVQYADQHIWTWDNVHDAVFSEPGTVITISTDFIQRWQIRTGRVEPISIIPSPVLWVPECPYTGRFFYAGVTGTRFRTITESPHYRAVMQIRHSVTLELDREIPLEYWPAVVSPDGTHAVIEMGGRFFLVNYETTKLVSIPSDLRCTYWAISHNNETVARMTDRSFVIWNKNFPTQSQSFQISISYQESTIGLRCQFEFVQNDQYLVASLYEKDFVIFSLAAGKFKMERHIQLGPSAITNLGRGMKGMLLASAMDDNGPEYVAILKDPEAIIALAKD